LRILTFLGLSLALLASDAEAGVGPMSGGALSSLAHLSPAQTVQYAADCWYDNGWNGPGYYPCGNEWNSRPDSAASSIIVPPFRRHHRQGAVVANPRPKPIYPGAPSPRVGAAAPSGQFHGGAGASAFGAPSVGSGWRRLGGGSAGVSPNVHPGAAIVTPGFAGGGFHGGLGGGNFHQFHNAGIPHIGAPISPGFTGAGSFHPGGAIGTPHIGAPASPGFAGAGGFHPGGAIGAPHIGASVSPGFAGGGTFHPGGAIGTPHIGAPSSPGFAGGGFHGVGGAGVFQGGGAAFGQGGIGHR
jgi:hypothetical protein